MKISYLLLILLLPLSFYGQKKKLEVDSYQSWPQVDISCISPDSKTVCYRTYYRKTGQNNWTVKTPYGTWHTTFTNLSNVSFSDDSKYLYAKIQSDSLLLLNLKNQQLQKIANITDYKTFSDAKNSWLAFLGKDKLLRVSCDKTNKKITLADVVDYQISSTGTDIVVLITTEGKNSEQLLWLDLQTAIKDTIYSGSEISDITIDKQSNQCIFLTRSPQKKAIQYYNKESKKTVELLNSNNPTIKSNYDLVPGNYWGFTANGEKILFGLQPPKFKKANPNLTIWNYQDNYLPTDFQNPENQNYYSSPLLAEFSIEDKSIIQLQNSTQKVIGEKCDPRKDRYLLLQSNDAVVQEEDWNSNALSNYYVCDLYSGIIKEFKEKGKAIFYPEISPESKYIIYYDPQQNQYISYVISTGQTHALKIKKNINLMAVNDNENGEVRPAGICGWLKNDENVLISSGYDILSADPLGKKECINLTGNVGTDNQTIIFPVEGGPKFVIGENNDIALYAFDQRNKNLGFYTWNLKTKLDLQKFNLQPKYLTQLLNPYASFINIDFLKSKKGNGYLFRLEGTNDAPNYYFSENFNVIFRISDNQPQKQFNWLTSKLCTYQDTQGTRYEGILILPEDFDVTKKYPVIINYYKTKSHELNKYLSPADIGGDISFSYLVSNGYPVFKANIITTPGEIGIGVLNSINAASNYLSAFNWVDSTKLAVAAHSVGGFETNYLVTHTNRFAAAISAAGISDLISASNDFPNGGRHRFIISAYNMGNSMAGNTRAYIENSPILYAKNVTTPLLIMHNPDDGSVDFRQGRNFFIELRSLKKPVWMLSYTGLGAGHGVGYENLTDYYSKMKNFFDHYLMDKPMSDWMQKKM